jgi:hypothetical protein
MSSPVSRADEWQYLNIAEHQKSAASPRPSRKLRGEAIFVIENHGD